MYIMSNHEQHIYTCRFYTSSIYTRLWLHNISTSETITRKKRDEAIQRIKKDKTNFVLSKCRDFEFEIQNHKLKRKRKV